VEGGIGDRRGDVGRGRGVRRPLIIKFKRWRQKGVDREEWALVIREAKALRGSKPRSK